MVRDMEKHKVSLENHNKWQFDYFTTLKNNIIKKAKAWKDMKNDLEKWDSLLTESEKMKYQFDKSTASINFGRCDKFDKEVTFIPNTCQLDTQECFTHRRD